MTTARTRLIFVFALFLLSTVAVSAHAQNEGPYRNDGHQGDYGLFGFLSSGYDQASGQTVENNSPSLFQEIFIPDNNRQKNQYAHVFPSYPLSYGAR